MIKIVSDILHLGHDNGYIQCCSYHWNTSGKTILV